MAPNRIISLAALTVLELSPPEMVAVASRCGYSHVGLRPVAATPGEVHFPILSDMRLLRETLASLREFDMEVLDIEILRLAPETRAVEFERVLAFGAEVGARFALLAGDDPNIQRTADNFAALAELALPYGIRPHLEFMPWTDVPSLSSAITVFQMCGNTNAGLLVDAFHLNRSRSQVTDISKNDSCFGYVQLCDIADPVPLDMAKILREARADRLFPGEGDCPLIELLNRVPLGTPVSIETPVMRPDLTAEKRAQMAFDATINVLAEFERRTDDGCCHRSGPVGAESVKRQC